MTDAVPPGARCSQDGCEREATDPTHPAGLCPDHHPDHAEESPNLNQQSPGEDSGVLVNAESDANPEEGGGSTGSNPTPDAGEGNSTDADTGRLVHLANDWSGADFTETDAATYPDRHTEFDQWMVRGEKYPPREREKAPYAPWSDANGAKWGQPDNRERFETAREWDHRDPRSDGLAFIQTDSDPLAFVDGDDVRCPETGDVHPEFVEILDRLGITYADVSTSGAGVHAYYEGGLPNDQSQAVFEIDTDPWGANEDPPTVEIYANKHVCLTTGERVSGTPDAVRSWDSDAVAAILDEYGELKESQTVDHDTDHDIDLSDHDPSARDRDESTTDARDIALAVDRLSPSDLPLRTRQTGADSTGWSTWDPSYRTSESGESLHYNGDGAFYDHKTGDAFGVLSLFAAEEGILRDPWDRLAGADWWDAIEAARDAGAPIPEYNGQRGDGDAEHTAVLPPAVRDLSTATTGWDWKHSEGDAGLTMEDARERTTTAIADAYDRYNAQTLIEALPTMGKSYGAVKAVRQTGEPVTILTGRGNKEQYGQIKDWCDEFGLEYKQLPRFTHDCPTAAGEHGEDWRETVMDWYRRGATPQEIHNLAEYHCDRPLPCQVANDGTHIDCQYRHVWNFDADEYDVLLGHYVHAHTQHVTEGRTVVFDEFPGAYETNLTAMQSAVSCWLEITDGVPFDSYTDLIEHRDDESRRGQALLWFDEHGIEPDETHVFDDSKAHADAPLVVYTLLAGEDLGNGFERADLGETGTGVFNRNSTEVSVLQPPALEYASGIVALDGTPTKQMWELALGERLTHRPVLQEAERAEYIEALDLNLVRSSEYRKPYNSADHVTVDKDAALLEAVRDEYGQAPSLITTMTAKDEYDSAGVLDLVTETKHYGDVLGSNQFKHTRLGAVIGSNHYGDRYVKKWGAYAGEGVTRQAIDESKPDRGENLTYGDFGDSIRQHMTEHETLQAAMRFGRDGNGAVVFVHTDTLPDWVPTAGEARVIQSWSDGMKGVIDALSDLETATAKDLVEHSAVTISRRQVATHLETLRDRGVLSRTRDGRQYRYDTIRLDRLNQHGAVDFQTDDSFSKPELSDLEVTRTECYYTWDFQQTRPEDTTLGTGAGDMTSAGAGAALSGDGPPPNPGD